MTDIINKIKIKKPDGSFTDYIPIGADAENVSMADGESVQKKINKKPYYYNSVAEMKADSHLKAGDCAITLGYYSANDGGNGEYLIKTKTQSDVEDNGSIHFLEKDRVAELIYDKIINVAQFGAIGDGVTDDTEAIQKAMNYLKDGMTIEFVTSKNYKINSMINIPSKVNVNGNDCKFKYTEEFTDEYTLYYGSRTPKQSDYTDNLNKKLININFINSDTSKIRNGIYIKDNVNIEGIYSWGLNKTIDITNEYLDFVSIKNINIFGKTGENYAINTGYQGDARTIERIHMHKPSLIGIDNMLYIQDGLNCCIVNTVINGNIYIGDSNVIMNDLHLEFGNITIKNSELKINNGFIWKRPGIKPIIINGNANAELNNIIVNYNDGLDYQNDDCIDLEIKSPLSNIHINNCFKNMMGEIISFKCFSGLKTNIPSFNENCNINSIQSIIRDRLATSSLPVKHRTGEYSILSTYYKDPNNKWKISTGEYFYKAIQLFDSVRLIGSINTINELSGTNTKGESAPYISMNGHANSNYRIYRGTSSGNYDKYSDVGIVKNYLIDNGHIINGTKWNDRETGSIDTILNAYSYKANNDFNKTVTITATGIPTVGTWKKGDIIMNYNPSDTSPKGWICTADGTPGTWIII